MFSCHFTLSLQFTFIMFHHFTSPIVDKKRYPNCTQEIVFPDHTVKYLYRDGLKETFFPDVTVVKVEKNRDELVVFNQEDNLILEKM
ncbi:unnamed protein product [Coccothraustes coccothraustes]